MVGLSYLADHMQRVRIGPVVALMAVRDPVMLARQAAALDDLSGGRMVLGLGAGGQERDIARSLVCSSARQTPLWSICRPWPRQALRRLSSNGRRWTILQDSS